MKKLFNVVLGVLFAVLMRFERGFRFVSWSLWYGWVHGKDESLLNLLVQVTYLKYKLVESKLNLLSEDEAVKHYHEINKMGAKTNYDNNTVVDGNVHMVDGLIIPPASSYPTKDGDIHIVAVPTLIAKQAEMACKQYHQPIEKGWRFVRFVMMHEIWHTQQFRYILDNGGLSLLKRVSDMELSSQYSEGPLEVGANRYAASKGKDKQDLSTLLAA